VLTDTAGLRDTDDIVERLGVERALGLSVAADVLVWLGESADAPEHRELILVHPRSDQPGRGEAPDGSLAVSSATGEGVAELLQSIAARARMLLPAEDVIALNRRQADRLAEAHSALLAAAQTRDIVLAAENLRSARAAFDQLTGRSGVEHVLDALFGRFCLGK
jgi:tRNA modification GTPase